MASFKEASVDIIGLDKKKKKKVSIEQLAIVVNTNRIACHTRA